jgi:Skp family chaperone for outer membrane proteins
MTTTYFAHVPRASARIGLALLVSVAAGTASSAPAPAPAPAAGPIVVAPPSTLTAPPRPVAPVAPAPAPAAVAPAPAAGLPLKIVVIDRNFILQRSSAGKEIVAQMQNLSKAADTEFRAQQTALQTEATQLQQQLAILAADVRDQKEKEFTAKEQALQTRVAQRQADLQATIAKAEQQLEVALEPILVAIMKERAASIVLDRNAVILGTADMDITPTAVDRLDKTMPHLKVDLISAPPVAAGTVPGVAAAPAPAAARPVAPAPAARPPAAPAPGK